MYFSEERDPANALLIPIVAQKIELVDEDYLGECSKAIKGLAEKSVGLFRIILECSF
jgi:hypothetical protein